ncbi:TetR/AcrR family transcriptional regulator [Streptomyces sp. G-G2]|uniref:TetR/AcrR family transcriptional regulator n=1 Tax=Streptomyces sp. G-G2 TaxID=3046201 RepID=UPI0024B8D0B8|nr:TetR/AcrR family transcriptional regulator [Streptomyces sp. G-G2]MDJ0386161.1 TetR/AcrR family transcriptional regulator [Streptomyces sp. G-G2]
MEVPVDPVAGGAVERKEEHCGRGRRRDPSRDDELCQAALELLAEIGYERLSIDAVAARAHAGKGAVYRRWSGKAELVIEAVGRLKGPLAEPDTGSLRGDLEEIACAFGEGGNVFETRVMAGLISAVMQDAGLREVFHQYFEKSRRQVLEAVLRRAVKRGEVAPQRDLELLAGLLPALVFQRVLLHGAPPDSAFARRVIREVILPLAAAP